MEEEEKDWYLLYKITKDCWWCNMLIIYESNKVIKLQKKKIDKISR